MSELKILREPSVDSVLPLRILDERSEISFFEQVLASHDIPALETMGIEVLQVNLGKLCNQNCHHCHVDAGPDRREIMTKEIAAACLLLLREADIPTLDLTGGAPEMNPHFRWIVEQAHGLKRRVIDRCNLTILEAPGYDDLPEFLAAHDVEVVASLPCYLEENVDRQRGNRVFQRSIAALRRLNQLGYGQSTSPLSLTLVFNPQGPRLPPNQAQLEQDYRRELRSRYSIEFTRLFTLTNMPISRFLDELHQSGQYETYMQKLIEAFNPATVDGLMCRSTLSVDWQGHLYDCDFNQMLDLAIVGDIPLHVRDLEASAIERLKRRRIVTGNHCFGCTAGSGSSCQGSLQY
ncbi:MAG: arsenosugar biosynthesis radical SAM protein ArsS [Planctomycetota bacterium]|nr:arsenosugar biosynthesis radical SAM protein ArsS [Planctomycetota bacterium]MDA1179729.1 arsenosugar biosynthesis radical SAM protein ArsS [Planctomycetota bacterium]